MSHLSVLDALRLGIQSKHFGALLKDRRELVGISLQRDLADRIGHASTSEICRWEMGKDVPPAHQLVNLIDVLKLNGAGEKLEFVQSWYETSARLDKNLANLMQDLDEARKSSRPEGAQPVVTLGMILQQEMSEALDTVWVLASETLQEHRLGLVELETTAQRARVNFCMEEQSDFFGTAREVIEHLGGLCEDPAGEADLGTIADRVRLVLKNVRFAALGADARFGLLSQRLCVHVFRQPGQVKAYTGAPSIQGLTDLANQLADAKAQDLARELRQQKWTLKTLDELMPEEAGALRQRLGLVEPVFVGAK